MVTCSYRGRRPGLETAGDQPLGSVVLVPCRMGSHGPDRRKWTLRRAEWHGLCRPWSRICPWWTSTRAAKEKWEKWQEVHTGRGGWGPGDSSGVAGSCGLMCRAGYASPSPLSGVACPDSFEIFQGLTIVMTMAGEYLCGVLYRLSFNALDNPKWALVPSLQMRHI